MNRFIRAAQLWTLLCHCAHRRETLTYEYAGALIDIPSVGMGQHLEPIQSYCLLKDLPPLTALVVNKKTGLPGLGFIGAADVPKALQEVFAFDWAREPAPSPDELRKAAEELPSNAGPQGAS